MFFFPENEAEGTHERMDPYLRAEQLYQDIVNARTYSEVKKGIDDAAPINHDANVQLVQAPVGALQRTEHLVIGPGDSGGLLTVPSRTAMATHSSLIWPC